MKDLNYSQRFALGAIQARQQFSEEARRVVCAAHFAGDLLRAVALRTEADRHEAEIIRRCREIAGGAA